MKNLLFLLFLALGITSNAQVAVNTDGTAPANSAMLDVKSISKGMLVPRMTTVQRIGITNPATGLLVYDNTTGSFWYNNATTWIEITTGSTGWNLMGNTGTDSAVNFIGTTDANDLIFRVNNIKRLRLTQNGSFQLMGDNENTIIGDSSGAFNTAGLNHFIGFRAGYSNITGSQNYFSGYKAGYANTTGSNNHFEGLAAGFLNTTGSANHFSGVNAGYSNTTGNDNYFSGVLAGSANTTGSQNYFSGNRAGLSNTTGSYNYFSGYLAGYFNTIGNYNYFSGYQAGRNNSTGNYNHFNGTQAGSGNNTGSYNTASGYFSLASNQNGYTNTAYGMYSLLSDTASFNTAIGGQSLQSNRSGTYNTSSGFASLYSNITGSNNTAIGSYALFNNTGGSNNIAIGSGSGTAYYAPAIFNTVSIGNDDFLNGYQNQVFLGNTSTAWIGGKVTWSTFSDARIKNNIAEDVKGLDFITRLRPVTYHISNKAILAITGNKETPDFPGKLDVEKVKYTGFIAQEVEQAANASGYDFSGFTAPRNDKELYTLSYEQFVVPLVKAVQELNAVNEAQKIINETLKATNEALKTSNEEMKQSLDELKMQNEELKQRMEKLENK